MRYRYRNDSEMKDSGVEWLGKIPKDWTIHKISNIIETLTDYVANGSFESLAKNVKYLNEEDYAILIRTQDNSNGFKGPFVYINESAYNFLSKSKVYHNDIIISNVGAVGSVFKAPDLQKPMSLAPNSILIRTTQNNEYIYYLLQSSFLQEEIKNIVSYTAQPKFNKTNFRRIKTITPSIKEQQKIANFLDEKTSQFDLIISKKEELIKKLEEAKKSLISEVVTGKVKVVKNGDGYELVKRSSEEMKDSGVEWLGDIPKDWSLEKGKWLFYNSNEKGDESKILLSATQDRGVIPKDQLDSVVQNKEDTDFTNFKLVKKYDFIISLRSFQGGFEMSQYDEGIITPAYSVLRSKIELNPYYYKYLLKERGFIGILNSLTVGIRDGKNIKYDDFAKVLLPKPPLKEQQAIYDYINISISNINSTIDKTNKQIEKLKEAKQSLISEAVTGKIEILD